MSVMDYRYGGEVRHAFRVTDGDPAMDDSYLGTFMTDDVEMLFL